MTTENFATTIEIRDNAYWPDEALLADFAGQVARAEQDDRREWPEQPVEDNYEYAALYFVS